MYRNLTLTAFLSVLILLSGSLKIPSPVAGGEFQLSAPVAVLICACFGFKRYLTAGIIASLLGLMLGTATIFNVMVAMVFRLVAGAVIAVGNASLPAVIIGGPLGTLAARMVIGAVLDVNWLLLATAAMPGMIFTAVTAGILYPLSKKLICSQPVLRSYFDRQRSNQE